ncbi:MAG: four helix bundle protein [Chloroflexi bacterium]|nr:four helix bundle protein [Chloroflexota bacterium]MBI3168456.1 four helix bundle protein [Chloroflexota bacterium]
MKTVPGEITQDPLWGLEVYRLGFFIADITWDDTEALFKNSSTRNAADQIRRSLDSISANIAEGYSRSTGKDRARYFEYSLGEAREARERIYKVRRVMKPEVVVHRLKILTQIVKMLNGFVPTQRKKGIREEQGLYLTLSEFENDILHSPMPES